MPAIQLTPDQLAAAVPDGPQGPPPPARGPIKLTPEQLAAAVPDAPPVAALTPEQQHEKDMADLAATGKLIDADTAARYPDSQPAKDARAAAAPAPPPDQPLQQAGILPQPVAPGDPGEDRGAWDAFVRTAGNAAAFGLGPTVNALSDLIGQEYGRVVRGQRPQHSYSELRQAYADALDAARANHPIAATVGDVTGSLPAAAITPEFKALQTASPLARGAVMGGVVSGAAGAGEAISHGKSAPEVARAAAESGVAGAVLGGALEHGAAKFVEGAPKAASNWVLKDIMGAEAKGGSTPTTRKQLVRDKADVVDVVSKDPELAAKLDAAHGNNPEDIVKAQQHVDGKVRETFAPREQLYTQLDAAAPKPVTAGDLVGRVQKRVDELAATLGTKRERTALSGVMNDIKETLGGGKRTVISPEAEIDGLPVARLHGILQENLGKTASAEGKAQIQGDIDALMKNHGTVQEFNPNAPVPSIKLRDSVSRLQEDVANAMGGLNERISEQRAREVLAPIHQALEDHLAAAAKKNPELVDQIAEMDRQGSALLRIQKVLKERANNAEQKELTGAVGKAFKMGHGVSGVGAVMALGSGHYGTAAALGGMAAAPVLKKGADRAMAAIIKKAARGPITGADAKAALDAGVSPTIVQRLLDGALTAGARIAKAGVERVLPRLTAREAAGKVSGMAEDFFGRQEGE